MKKKQSLGLLVGLGIFAGLLMSCGDSATPAPAAPAPAGNPTTSSSGAAPTSGAGTSGASNTGAKPAGDAASIIKNSQSALAGIKDYQATMDMTFTGQGAGNLVMDVIQKGGLAGVEDTGQGPQFKGTVTKSTLPTIPTGVLPLAPGKGVIAALDLPAKATRIELPNGVV